MKSNFGNGIGKKVVAVLLLLSMTAGMVFSAPLAVVSGDAKIYDSTYKSVKNASEASDGYVIRTDAESILLENGDVKLSVEPNSLVQVISLDGNPDISWTEEPRSAHLQPSPSEQLSQAIRRRQEQASL